MGQAYLKGISVLLRKTSVVYTVAEPRALGEPLRCLSLGDEERFRSAYLSENHCNSEEEVANSYQILKREAEEIGLGIFALILKVSEGCLHMDGTQVRCAHDSMLRWRSAVHGIGQTMFLCAYLARMDRVYGYERRDFAYGPYAKTDDLRLQNLLAQGMAENHFHLKGSAPAFLLTWVCLMNHIDKRQGTRGFAAPDMARLFYASPQGDEAVSLHDLVCIAAEIRLFLWRLLQGTVTDGERKEAESSILEWLSTRAVMKRPVYLQDKIDAERIREPKALDYILKSVPGLVGNETYAALAGENYFLYRMFRAIWEGDARLRPYWDFFYAYLLVSVRLRGELVQSNHNVGFHNFARFQDRKAIFLKGYPMYEDELVRIAYRSALDQPALRSLEVRIVPDKQCGRLKKQLHDYTHLMPPCPECAHELGRLPCGAVEERDQRIFFVLHLPKRTDAIPNVDELSVFNKCRHHAYRYQYVKPVTEAVIRLFQSGDPMAARVYGLDACSQEIGCRPEVFAPYFRHAKRCAVVGTSSFDRGKTIPVLRFTYHVGEDFLDFADGLRAIDETVNFLELRSGDRLGHAMALGLEPEMWYTRKGSRLVLPRQDVLDNLVWVYKKAQEFDLGNHGLRGGLKELYQYHCNIIFQQDIPLDVYYEAWKLRGDEPGCYIEANMQAFYSSPRSQPEGYLLAGDSYALLRRLGGPARKVLQRYHYDPQVKLRGAQMVEFSLLPGYVETVAGIQKRMRQELSQRGIGIETNPSSNYLIGNFRRYDKHPILRMNDMGLRDQGETEQLFVSINTDDQGIFDTDLENEYALMACALGQVRSASGQPEFLPAHIYEWIDHVRKMGLEQSFRQIDQTTRGNLC